MELQGHRDHNMNKTVMKMKCCKIMLTINGENQSQAVRKNS